MIAVAQPAFLTVVAYLAVALVLASLIGLEREFRHKSAGLRTNALVGLGAALFMVVGKYGFFDVVQPGVTLDPSRVAAQIVTGIGFIGGGIIFVKRGDVRGLTTAAGVWLTAAVGMAAGGGLLAVAVVTTAAYYLVAFVYPHFVGALRKSRPVPWLVHLEYVDGRGALRAALAAASREGFDIGELSIARDDARRAWTDEGEGQGARAPASVARARLVSVDLELVGKGPLEALAEALGQIDGVLAVRTEDVREEPR